MEKTVHSPINYPRMPAEMSCSGTQNADEPMLASPPSYEQATGATTAHTNYPPVQVLPTPHVDTLRRPRPPPTPAATTTTTTQTHILYNNPPYAASHASPPQHSAYVPPMVQQPVVIIQQHAVLPLGPDPAYITCPACHVAKLTRIDYEPSTRTHLMAALLCIFGLWCCVCLPYCAGSCMNANHYCGNCNKFLGTYGGDRF